jgi:hypothetical protein
MTCTGKKFVLNLGSGIEKKLAKGVLATHPRVLATHPINYLANKH